jgi:hypothetical protein
VAATRRISPESRAGGVGPLPEVAGVDDDAEMAPASEVRPLDGLDATGSTATLLVHTTLAAANTRTAWVTVTRAGGIVCFEGPPAPDGVVRVTLEVVGATRLSVCLETERSHRQAEVVVRPGSNVYAFS